MIESTEIYYNKEINITSLEYCNVEKTGKTTTTVCKILSHTIYIVLYHSNKDEIYQLKIPLIFALFYEIKFLRNRMDT